MKTKNIVVALATLLLGGMLFTACSSSSSKSSTRSSSSSKSSTCPICGETLDSSNSVECTSVTGEHMTVCGACYTVGRQAGKCM